MARRGGDKLFKKAKEKKTMQEKSQRRNWSKVLSSLAKIVFHLIYTFR